MLSLSTVGITDGAEICALKPVVWWVGKPIKIRPDFVGMMLAKISTEARFLGPDPFTLASGICGDVRIASFVILGGGFFVALSSSSLNDRLVNVSIIAVLTFRKTTVDERDVRSPPLVSFRYLALLEEGSS